MQQMKFRKIQEVTGKAFIGLELNIIDTAVNEWKKRLLACSHIGPTFQAN